jgi:REP element-mobilizing transposase RayT
LRLHRHSPAASPRLDPRFQCPAVNAAFVPQRLRRIYGFGHLHFITFSCYRRLPLLGSAHARNVFVQILNEVRDQLGFALVGFVVMPEHVHLLIGEPKRGNPSMVLYALKQRVSTRLRHRRRRRWVFLGQQIRFRNFGSSVSTISMSGAGRKRLKSSATCI